MADAGDLSKENELLKCKVGQLTEFWSRNCREKDILAKTLEAQVQKLT
jgi:hypothetical protein